MNTIGLTVEALQNALAARETTATEVCTAVLDRIEALNPELNAFITITRDRALAQAAQVDADLAAGKPFQALTGVPIAVKDNQCLKGVRTTCASKILGNFQP
ncbi:MAG TPA: amidase family protein, partial [Acidobacteriota bacterium]|nr:amidase family protein [Acidobacteriota bacterium]